MFNVGFIGASKTGTVLADYFIAKGLNLSGFYSINKQALNETIIQLNCKQFYTVNELVKNSNIIFITTKDDDIVNQWMNIDHSLLTGKFVYHCSGVLPSNILTTLNTEVYIGSLHPMVSIHCKAMDLSLMDNINFAIEGDLKALEKLEGILSQTQNNFITLDPNEKNSYHIACVAMTSFYISLYQFAKTHFKQSVVKKNGIGTDDLLISFTQQIIHKINSGLNVRHILTGPLVRGDCMTLKKHMTQLNGNDKKLYEALTCNLLNLCKLMPNTYKNLIEALEIGEPHVYNK